MKKITSLKNLRRMNEIFYEFSTLILIKFISKKMSKLNKNEKIENIYNPKPRKYGLQRKSKKKQLKGLLTTDVFDHINFK